MTHPPAPPPLPPGHIRVFVRFPSQPVGCNGETLLAREIGPGLAEVKMVPMLARGLHYGDEVRLCEGPEHHRVPVLEVVRPSGMATLCLTQATRPSSSPRWLQTIRSYLAKHETIRAPGRNAVLEMRPGADPRRPQRLYIAIDPEGIAAFQGFLAQLWPQTTLEHRPAHADSFEPTLGQVLDYLSIR